MKVGDKVIVKTNLKLEIEYGDLSITEEMLEFLGKQLTISTIDIDGDFLCKETDEWWWNKKMVTHKIKNWKSIIEVR